MEWETEVNQIVIEMGNIYREKERLEQEFRIAKHEYGKSLDEKKKQLMKSIFPYLGMIEKRFGGERCKAVSNLVIDIDDDNYEKSFRELDIIFESLRDKENGVSKDYEYNNDKMDINKVKNAIKKVYGDESEGN